MARPGRLPQGSSGLPLAGETLPATSGMPGFIRASTERQETLLGGPDSVQDEPERWPIGEGPGRSHLGGARSIRSP